MSRLIFRNLPPSITSTTFSSQIASTPSLKEVTLTDARVNSKRRFAFAGFKSSGEAEKVKAWFDGSYAFGGGKVTVEVVRDQPLAEKPVKSKSSKTRRLDKAQNGSSENENQRLKEFMEVMKGGEAESSATAAARAAKAVPGDEGWKAEGLPGKKEKKSKKETQHAEVVDDPEPNAEDDDAAWLKRRQKELDIDPPSENHEPNHEGGGDEPHSLAVPLASQIDPDHQLVSSTGRLFIRNLPFVSTKDDLETHFSRFGVVEEVHVPLSSDGQPLGTAFVLYRDPADALSAYQTLDKTTFQGRLLHVLPGRAKPGQDQSGVVGIVNGEVLGKSKLGKGEVKKGVDARRKEEGSRGVNWATLYMNSDAVAASVASRMGISKSDLLNGDDGNAAVKLALAETHVIEETKKYFEEQGIVLDSLSPRVPRSPTTILVKNIPFGTTANTLTDLFSPHGELKRVLLPPSGTLGVVEFANSSEAGKAFKALSYRRLGNAVLYLEKGPVGMFKEPPSGSAPAGDAQVAAEKKALEEKAETAARDAPDPSDEAGSTLFLKNLSFGTTTERLSSVLSSLAGFSFARVQTKPDPKRPGERLSMGYGFVGFNTKDAANKALAALGGFEVDGKALEVKFAQRGVEDVQRESKSKEKGGEMQGKTKSTKVLVKNLPFEATKKDLRELFSMLMASAYGQIKSLRLPKKPTMSATGAHASRGFAFLEFTTHVEAQRAMDALKHTHLLGRHLVLQWARDDVDVDLDRLREKAGRDARFVGDAGEPRGKKRKIRMDEAGTEEMDGLEVE